MIIIIVTGAVLVQMQRSGKAETGLPKANNTVIK